VLGRLELDRRDSGEQALSIEDTSGCIHASWGVKSPASPQLISEVDVVCRLAKAVLPDNPRVRWEAYARDYAEIRKEI
ncbi:formate dehydrogenase oxidoreductase, partial [Escherichia coli]